MEDRIKKVFSDILGVDQAEVNINSSPDNIDTWDSMNHTNLVMGLEQEFGITFEPEEIIEMMNFELVKLTIQEKIS